MDLIDRQDAIDAIIKYCMKYDLRDLLADIEALPSAERTGHWIDDKCSVCGKGTEDFISSREWYRNEEPNFCPFCGVKLVEPQVEGEKQMEAYLEDNRPTIDEVCESYDECNKECPLYKFCYPQAEKERGMTKTECDILKALPSADTANRVFESIVAEYPKVSTYKEYEGKPYFSIKYIEDGQQYIGYGTYNPEVLSEYLRKYFMPSAESEIIHCENCKWWDQKFDDSPMGYCMAAKHNYYSPHWEINIQRTYGKNFFCADAEPKEGEEE